MKDFEKWIEELPLIHLPRYEELSEISLYLDQILEYVNVKLSVLFAFDDVILTQAMINNYVKHKVMPAPEKKRYERDHLVYIIAITILKKIMNIHNISAAVDKAIEMYGIETSYNLLIDYIEESMKFTLGEIKGPSYTFQKDDIKGSMAIPFKAATLAFSAKLLADYSFKYLVSKEDI
ncbi:MAG: DUF1836 domain-containing protein [Erysipelothrix sp.]|nr:DUF1836 domain-containing protein [Erysipelothrix sp.]